MNSFRIAAASAFLLFTLFGCQGTNSKARNESPKPDPTMEGRVSNLHVYGNGSPSGELTFQITDDSGTETFRASADKQGAGVFGTIASFLLGAYCNNRRVVVTFEKPEKRTGDTEDPSGGTPVVVGVTVL